MNINSKIYRWTGTSESGRFSEFQSIATVGAMEWEFFEMAGTAYLAVANHFDRRYNYYHESKIYKWDGTRFEEFQSIPTVGAKSIRAFEIAGVTYLAVANERDGHRHYIDSIIYKPGPEACSNTDGTDTNGDVCVSPAPATHRKKALLEAGEIM